MDPILKLSRNGSGSSPPMALSPFVSLSLDRGLFSFFGVFQLENQFFHFHRFSHTAKDNIAGPSIVGGGFDLYIPHHEQAVHNSLAGIDQLDVCQAGLGCVSGDQAGLFNDPLGGDDKQMGIHGKQYQQQRDQNHTEDQRILWTCHDRTGQGQDKKPCIVPPGRAHDRNDLFTRLEKRGAYP
jgi:hypothetical protein